MNAIYSDHNLSVITEEQMLFERDVYSHSLLVLCLAFHTNIAMCAFMIFFTSSKKYSSATFRCTWTYELSPRTCFRAGRKHAGQRRARAPQRVLARNTKRRGLGVPLSSWITLTRLVGQREDCVRGGVPLPSELLWRDVSISESTHQLDCSVARLFCFSTDTVHLSGLPDRYR
jgi:hypothetical protein